MIRSSFLALGAILLMACGGMRSEVDAAAEFALTVATAGNGSGTVTSAPAGISCGGACTASYAQGASVTLTAAPASGSSFMGWSGGGCAGTAPCTVTLAAATTVTATFLLDDTLMVALAGTGTGSVASSPAGITCGADCDEPYAAGTAVTLTATAAAGSSFAGWSGGGCTGTGACTITLSAATLVTATFALVPIALTVVLAGNGQGVVTSSPAGITCGTDCMEGFLPGTAVTLTAAPAVGASFAGWSGGGCSGTGTCTVTLDAATAVSATFTANPTVAVTRDGTGAGTVGSAPAGIDCGADCAEAYGVGTNVVLTATPAVGSAFTGWAGGGCAGTGTCSIGVSADVTVTATFTLRQFPLTVTRAGNGSGTVSSSPAGITCGADCTESYDVGTMVTLTAAPAAGSTFTGWTGGGCSGTGTCITTIGAATAVTATFTPQQFTLTVTRANIGTGTVTSAPAGITCGATCAASFDAGTVVTLTATPAVGSTFVGWTGGGCSGTGTCVTTINAAIAVTATFLLQHFTLTVIRAGTGTGTVTSAPTGINCGVTCAASFNVGAVVTLTATAAVGSTFAGWTGGGCTGTGTCVPTAVGATSVIATFTTTTTRDAFSIADTSTIPGWAERGSAWAIITKGARTQPDGCVRFPGTPCAETATGPVRLDAAPSEMRGTIRRGRARP